MNLEEPEGEELYRWIPAPEDNITGFDDIADEYVVCRRPEVPGGILIWGRYHGRWEINPWMLRNLISHLLKELRVSHDRQRICPAALSSSQDPKWDIARPLDEDRVPGD